MNPLNSILENIFVTIAGLFLAIVTTCVGVMLVSLLIHCVTGIDFIREYIWPIFGN